MEFPNHYVSSPDPNIAINTNVTPYVQNFSSNPSNIPSFTPLAGTYGRPLSYQQSDPRYKPILSGLLSDNIYQKSDDELLLETYLSKIGKINLSLHANIEILTKKPTTSTSEKKTLKIHVAKTLLHKCLQILKELEKIQQYLRENVATISSSEWKQKTIELGQQKDQFSALLAQFDDSNILEQLKKSLSRRKRKRLSQKRKKAARREELAEVYKNRQVLHKNIDKWLENMKEEVENAKREETLKKDADCILSEVTKKKYDARKQMSLLSALVKLRSVRENVAVQRGEKVSLEDSKAFKRNAEKLFSMWEKALRTYCIEEHGLRTMLEENAANDLHKAVPEERKIVAEWETILFGPKVIPCDAYWGLTCAEKDLATFIAIRKSWDTFLVPNDNMNASRIPIGWALPDPNCSPLWARYLQNNKSA